MRKINIFYWVLTGLLVPLLGIGSVMEVAGDTTSTQVVLSLGYPAYISVFLAGAKILALIAILIPGYHRIKEWAYAGLVFDVIGAIYSLAASGRPFSDLIIPAATLAIIFGSYYFHHRRIQQKNLHLAAGSRQSG